MSALRTTIESSIDFRAKCLVRPAALTDIASIRGIYANAVESTTHTFETEAPDEAEIIRRWRATLERGLPYLVAELEGYVVGYSYASQYRSREGYRFTVEDSIYVRPDCVGNGVGRTLLVQLLRSCKEKGAIVWSPAFAASMFPLCRCTRRLVSGWRGFFPEAGLKFGEWLRLTIMKRMLHEGLAQNQ